ncbi:MAG: ArsA family ATPase, partial [Gemmatimonadetes bacterium]|nr:ArsA family ATPase [Gemmatimonadota bacterium]
CALALARDRDVELLGMDPAGSLGDALDQPVDDGGVEVAPRLVARELDAERAFREFKERYRDEVEEAFRRVGLDRAAALDRRVVQSLLELAPPGVDELLAVTALLEQSGPGTTRVVDTAPTGHLLRLLETPENGLAWVRQLMRVLVKYRAALGLDALAERLIDLAKRLKDLNLRLKDPDRSGAVVVTLSGPLDAAETGRLLPRLNDLGIPVAALVRNRWHADAADAPSPVPAPTVRAPPHTPPPVGVDGLRDFLSTWTVP